MQQRFIVKGVPPYDGTYEVDLDARPFTTRELGWVKRFAGYLPAEIDESKFSDPELTVVLVLIALRRNGKIEVSDAPRVFERLIDAPFDESFDSEDDEVEDDSLPPSSETSSNGSPVSSGLVSPTSSATSEPSPSPSGTPGSGFTEFDRPTSAR